jgi:hypothetical protein
MAYILCQTEVFVTHINPGYVQVQRNGCSIFAFDKQFSIHIRAKAPDEFDPKRPAFTGAIIFGQADPIISYCQFQMFAINQLRPY